MRINVARSSLPPFEEYCREIRGFWDSRWLTNNGEKVLELESALQTYLGAPHVVLFSNGHLALEAILRVSGLTGEVITTPFTFASTTHALVRLGLTPVFADVRPDTCTLDPEKIETLITPRTTAILPVHVYGHYCDVDAIAAIASRHNLRVIYDAAHTFGGTLGGKSAAAFGDAAMFSFHATKVFHTIEGGAVACQSAELAEKLRLERNFGITGPETTEDVGGNAKMNEFQAAMGLCNLRHLKDELQQRRRVCTLYRARLSGAAGLRLSPEREGDNYAYFPVFFDGPNLSRDEAYARLAAHDIYARKYFYPLTSTFSCYAGRFDPGKTPVAKRLSESVLTLPLYAGLSDEDVNRICELLLEAQ
ncbi:MAG: DegT/DnrJ/EryC1/StrS family aminotransferase [Eubacteriales bacterium]|nr:DegT/DnrJ/EryC1/StrS family aminotransferase [Eubacteriales bacterium]